MPSPYKSKTMRIVVNGVTIDTCELANLEILHIGNVESKYGQDASTPIKPWNRHAVGMKKCRFTIRKWYKADNSNTDLFYTLFDNDTEFTLTECLVNVSGSTITIYECEIYTFTPITGTANDITQEEITGYGLISGMVDPTDLPFILYIYEEWNYGPPTFGSELWYEPWSYPDPPTFNLLWSEPWSS
jgi:hypothetical protein